jgi:hypothetical protein
VWLRSGWEAKHIYTFTWFGRHVIQLPAHPGDWVIEEPPWAFCESELRRNVTHWPGGWIRRVR